MCVRGGGYFVFLVRPEMACVTSPDGSKIITDITKKLLLLLFDAFHSHPSNQKHFTASAPDNILSIAI